MKTRMRTWPALVLALFATSATALPGVTRWSAPMDAPLVAQPAVSASGRIAVLTEKSLKVLAADGSVEATIAEIAAGKPAQPFWNGESLWFRTEGGWRSWSTDGLSELCATSAASGSVDASGQAVFAGEREFSACSPAKTVLFKRHGYDAQAWPFVGGWFLADDWYLESLTPAGAARGGGLVTNLGFPAGPAASDELVVATPEGGLAGLDQTARVRWRGPPGLDGPPVTTRSGQTVLLANRSVFMADPPRVTWQLDVPAGVRAAAALDDGSVVVLERTGHLARVVEGRVVWSKRLENSGNILAAHPAGFVLVQDAGALVAIAMPAPDAGAKYPVALGVDRSGRAQKPADRARCPAPPPGRVTKKTMHVDGLALVDGEKCSYPALDVPIAGSPGKQLFRVPCGEGCLAAAGDGRVIVSDAPGRIDELDVRGKRKTLKKKGDPLAPIGVDATHVYTVSAAKLGSPTGRAVVFDGALAGLDANGRLWTGSDEREVKRFELTRQAAPEAAIATFGPMVCAQGSGRAGCFANGQLLPPRPLAPRVAFWGERVETCDSGLCLASAGAPTAPFWKGAGPVQEVVSLGDGTLAVLAGGRVTALWPDGSVRWEVPLGDACTGETWLVRASASMLVARACGVLVAIDTGLR